METSELRQFLENTEIYLIQCLRCHIANRFRYVTYSKIGTCTGQVCIRCYRDVQNDMRKKGRNTDKRLKVEMDK